MPYCWKQLDWILCGACRGLILAGMARHSSPVIGMIRNLNCCHSLHVIAQHSEGVTFVPPLSMWIGQISYWCQHINTDIFNGKAVWSSQILLLNPELLVHLSNAIDHVDNFQKLAWSPKNLVSVDFFFASFTVEAWVEVVLLWVMSGLPILWNVFIHCNQ